MSGSESRIPGCQEDLVSNWESACSLVEDACLWSRVCPLPSGSGCCMPASLPLAGDGLAGPLPALCRQLSLLWY